MDSLCHSRCRFRAAWLSGSMGSSICARFCASPCYRRYQRHTGAGPCGPKDECAYGRYLRRFFTGRGIIETGHGCGEDAGIRRASGKAYAKVQQAQRRLRKGLKDPTRRRGISRLPAPVCAGGAGVIGVSVVKLRRRNWKAARRGREEFYQSKIPTRAILLPAAAAGNRRRFKAIMAGQRH